MGTPFVILAFLCLGSSIRGADAQMWAAGYPKLQFGALAPSPSLSIPVAPGAGMSTGEAPQDIIIRIKASDATSAQKFTAGKVTIELQLSSFIGADNTWNKTSSGISAIAVGADGVLSTSNILVAYGEAVTWKATTRTLSIMMENIQTSDITTSEIAIALDASNFVGGKGPIAPRCLTRNAPLYVKNFISSGTQVDALRGAMPSVAPIGCLEDAVVPFGVFANSWDTKRIGQNAKSCGIGMEVTITITLKSRIDIYSVTSSVQSQLVISGLVGSQTPNTNSLHISSESTELYSTTNLFQTGKWQQSPGTLTLTIRDGSVIPAGVPFVFSFDLKLPAAQSQAPTVYITANTGSTTVIPVQRMDSALRDSAALTACRRTFITAKIGQSVSGGGQENAIFITISSNYDIQSTASYQSKIIISGLTGSDSPDSSQEYKYVIVPISSDSVQGIFSHGTRADMAEWSKNIGKLTLHIERGKFLKAGTEYVFSVKLLNRIEPQASPRIYIQASGETDTGLLEMQRGVDAPMFISTPSLSIAKIAQSTSSVGARNELTISLKSTVGIQTMAGGQILGAVTLLGLKGFQDASGQLPVTNKGYNSIQGLFARDTVKWDRTAGTLVFELARGQQLSPGKIYIFSITMTNPEFAQMSPDIMIELSGAPSAGLKKVSMDKASGVGAPLRIDVPDFKVLRIGQQYSGAGVPNQLSVTFQPNLILGQGHKFTIEGLKGSGTSDTDLLLTGCDGVFQSALESASGVANRGSWSQSSGKLEFFVSKSISATTAVACSFFLINPPAPQAAPQVTITVSSVANGQVSKVIGPKIFRNAPDKKAPFMVSAATFLVAKLGQSSPYPGSTSNHITISLQSNVAIGSVGGIMSSITISGLRGSETSDNAAIALTGDKFATDVVGLTASWTKSSGTLLLAIANTKSMNANTLYTFSFVIANPSKEQVSPAVSISSDGGQPISIMPMTPDMHGCIHTPGDTAPLYIYARGFLKKNIGVTAPWPQASNVLSITLQSSFDISSLSTIQTRIVVSGLTFSTNFNPELPMTSSAPLLFGTSVQWNADPATKKGTLTLRILPGQTLSAGTEYQVDVPMKNENKESTWKPVISIEGLGEKLASEMQFGDATLPIAVTFGSLRSNTDVAIALSFVTRQKIFKSDSIIISLPEFQGTSTEKGKQIWGIKSEPSAFNVEVTEDEYFDSIAAGNEVAEARYRVGSSGRTGSASSDAYGERGSTLVIDTQDMKVFGESNIYAGMKISIDGSKSYHSIYQQSASAPNHPAIAHFYPKYKYGVAEAVDVPAGALYVIHSQIELTSKSDICAGTKVNITIPLGSGLKTPANGISKGVQIRLSHVKMGFATAVIGTPDTIASATEQFSGLKGRTIQVTLNDHDPTSADYRGLPWAPTALSTSNLVFVDGFRTISQFDTNTKVASILTGYGPVRKTQLHKALGGLKGARLEHSKNIDANSHDMWLTLTNALDIKPSLKEGSYLQLQAELLRFTGEYASAVSQVTLPAQVGVGCTLNQVSCGSGNNCATVTFTGCSDNPSASVTFENGVVSGFQLLYRGACKEVEESLLTGTLTLSADVSCQTNPSCGTGCKVESKTFINSVIKVARRQFSTDATSLTCANSPCTNWVKSSVVYLTEGTLGDLLYTSSSKELEASNKQSVKIGYSDIADTVVGGNHVVSIGIPQHVGSNCRKVVDGVNQECTLGDKCASIVFSGCSVNPTASLTFQSGIISAVQLSGSADIGRYGQSVCQPGEKLAASIALDSGVQCDSAPTCGTGCAPILDTTKDALIIKHRSTSSDVTQNPLADVVRVHSPSVRMGSQILLVPPTLCTVLQEQTNFEPGQCAEAPKNGSVLNWIDPASGSILASMYVTKDGLSTLCLDFTSGSLNNYPSSCAISCRNTTVDGNLVASKSVNITMKYSGNVSDVQVVLSMPITLNTAYNAQRRVAPQGFQYRLNGNCSCPPSFNTSVNCSISNSGIFQAHLLATNACDARRRDHTILAAVLIAIGILCCILCGGYAYDRKYRRPREEQELPAKDAKDAADFEGPVFVGRPIPITPVMQHPQPAPVVQHPPRYAVLPETSVIHHPPQNAFLPAFTPVPQVSPVPIHNSVAPQNLYVTRDSAMFATSGAMWNITNSFNAADFPATLTPAPRPVAAKGNSPVPKMSSEERARMKNVNRFVPPSQKTPPREEGSGWDVRGDEYLSYLHTQDMARPRSTSPESRSKERVPYGV